jgi:hypothetical protein
VVGAALGGVALVAVITVGVVAIYHRGGSSGQTTACSALQDAGLDGQPAINVGTPSLYEQDASNFRQAAQRYRQAAQHVSTDPPLVNDLTVVANQLQDLSATFSPGGTIPSAAQLNQLADDLSAVSAMCPLQLPQS